MNIMDLVSAIAPESRTDFIGIRPGEKLHEVLMSADETRHAIEMEDLYAILPDNPSWGESPSWSYGKAMTSELAYTSDTNPCQLSAEELSGFVDKAI